MRVFRLFALLFLIFCAFHASLFAQGNDGAQVTGACTPFPCPAPDNSQIFDSLFFFNPTIYGSDYSSDGSPLDETYRGDTLSIHCGWIYKFYVVAGTQYEWNTDISEGVVTPYGGNGLKTKITLFYDDFQTYARASQTAVHLHPEVELIGTLAAGLTWIASYTGVVGIMVTRGDDDLDTAQTYCACNGDDLLLRYDIMAKSSNIPMVWGRYGTTDTIACDNKTHVIYDAGLGSSEYSNNENGYLVLYPGDQTSKLKLWGDSKLKEDDTLFIYNGNLAQNPNLVPYDTIVGQQQLGSENNPIFISAEVNQPITLRMQTDTSCTWDGFFLRAKCCMNPGLPTDLTGSMVSDTSALLIWNAAEGNEIQYNWTLYTADSIFLQEGNTYDTSVMAMNLNPNECYFYTISVVSACSMEQGSGENDMDIVYSNTFCYPYFVTLGDHQMNFNFNTDTLYVPDGAYIDTDCSCHLIVHESEMRVCYGNKANICYSFPENVTAWRQMIWKTSYQFDSVWTFPLDSTAVLNDTNIYYSYAAVDNLTGCFETQPLTEPGYVILDVWTEGHSLARAILHIVIDTIPHVYITYNGMDTSQIVSCESLPMTLTAHGANIYQWSDSLSLQPFPNSHQPLTSVTIYPTQNNAYYVTGTNSHGCKASDTISSLINMLPDLEYEQNETICLGDSIWLHVEGINQYTWQRIDTIHWDSVVTHGSQWLNKTDFLNQINHTPSYDGVYNVTRNCPPTNIAMFTITTSQLQDTAFMDSVITDNCYHSFTYKSLDHFTRPEAHTIAQGSMDSVQVAPRIGTDYVVFGTDTNGCPCRDSAVIHVNVLPHPVILETYSTGMVCAQDTVTLVAVVLMDGNYTFQWMVEGDSTVIGTGTVLRYVPDTSTTIYFSAFHPNGCDTTVAFPVEVFPHPDITLTAFPDTICPHQQSTLTVVASGDVTWAWEDGSTSPVRVVSPEANSTYYVQSFDEHGCTITDYVSLYLKPLPDPEVVSNDSICVGMSDTIVLSGTASHYQWLNDGVHHNALGDTMFVTPAQTTAYSVAYDNEYGCWDTAHFSIFVYAFPQPQITQDTTICRGDTIALTASGGAHFLWDDAQHSTTESIWVSPDDTTTYCVMVYDYLECFATDSVKVSVIPYFDLSITASADSVCPNTTVVFSAHGGENYHWNGNSSVSSSTFSLLTDSTTVVSLSAANPATNCSRTVYDTLFVYPWPDFHIESARDTICLGDSLTLTLVGDAVSYHWSTGDSATTLVLYPQALTTYSVTGYSEYHCEKTLDYPVVVNELPMDFTLQVGDALCYGDSLAVNVTPVFTDVQYVWNYPNLPSGTYSFFYSPLQDMAEDYVDTLSLAIVDVRGCQRVKQTEIMVYALPRDTIFGPSSLCRGDTLYLSTTGQYQYYWHQPISQDQKNNPSVWDYPSQPQTYTVDVVNAHNCRISLSKGMVIHEIPVVTINTNGVSQFCDRGSYLITASGASQYLWSDGQTGASVHLTPGNQTTYSVTGTDVNGCLGTRSVALDVISAPELQLQVLPLDTICALDTFTIQATGTFNHIVWNTLDTTYSITRSNIIAPTWFYATASDEFLEIPCEAVDSVLVMVYPVPQLNVVSIPPSICANDSGLIAVSGADAYQWQPHPHLIPLGGAEAKVVPEPSITGYIDTFVVQGILNGFNCTSVMAIPFVVDSLPNLQIDVTSSGGGVCLNDTITLTAQGGSHHFWYNLDNPTVVISTQRSLTVVPTGPASYMLVGYNARGCVDTAYYNLQTNEHPTLSISVSDTAVCYGFPVQLTAQSNASHYSWSSSISPTEGNNSNLLVATPPVTTTYRVKASDGITGCYTVDSAIVVVYPSPIAASDAPAAACLGDSLEISLSGAAQYAWYGADLDNTFFEGDRMQLVTTEAAEVFYQVIATDGLGCKDTLPIAIMVHPLPDLTLQTSSPGYLCHDGSQFLGVVAQSNIAGTEYHWNSYPTDASMTASQNVAFVSPDTTTEYIIEGYYTVDEVVCHAFDTTTVVVYPVPNVIASVYPQIPCQDMEAVMTATGASQYIWFADDQMVGVGSTYTVVPVMGTQYVVVGTDLNHCVSRDTLMVNTVHVPPVDSIIGANAVCFNTPSVLRTSGNNHCEWVPSTGLSEMSDSAVTVTLTTNTDYTVYVTNEHGCRDTMTYSVSVYPLPELVMPADTVLCESDPFTFRVSGATYYVWEDGSTNDFRTVYPSLNTTSYSVTGTNQYGCVAADSFSVTVFPAFDLHIVASRDTFCIEDNAVTLIAYGAGDNYLWNTGSTDSIITVYPTSTTAYTLTAFNTTAGCHSSITREIVRMDNPDATISSSVPYLCLHDTATLSVQLEPGGGVVWSTGETSSNIGVSPQDTATYSAVVTNAFGCQTSGTFTVNVLPLPQVGILSSDSVLCYGQTVTLTAIGNADLYQWSTGQTAQSITVTHVTDEDFVLTGYTSALCHSTDTAHVTIRPLPIGTISGTSGTVCPGDTVVLTLLTNANYVWTDTSDLVQINNTTTWVMPDATTVYTAVMTNAYGCVDSTHFVVPVYEPLPLQITPDTTLCYGAGLDITVSGSWNYIWNDGFQGNSQYVTPEQTTTYSVSSTDVHDCITTVSTTVTVQPDYTLTIHHDKDTICVGDSVTLWYVGAVDQHYWSTGSTASQITVSPQTDATYSIWAYNNSTSCAKTVFDTIVVIPYPVFMLSAANLVCSGDTLSVHAFSDYAFDYQWSSVPEGSIITAPDSAQIWVSPQVTTTYIYRADNHFCTLTDSVVVEVAPSPVIVVSELTNESCGQGNGSIELQVLSEYPPYQYHWSSGEGNAPEIQNLQEGVYSVTVTDALGCTSSLEGIEIVNIPPPQISVTSALAPINGHDGSIDIDVPSSYGNYTIEWFLNSMNNPLPQYYGYHSIEDLDSGYYYVMVTDEACSTIEQIFLPHLYFGQGNLYIPNTITPSNEDGMNDYFQLYYHGDIVFKEVLIYNRWGTLVFQSNDIHFKWDGSVNGEILYNNVYAVLLYYYDYRGTEHIIKGFLLVL